MGKAASLQQPRPAQQQRPGGDGGDEKPIVSPELLQEADDPIVQQHRQGLPDARQHQGIELLPAKLRQVPVGEDGEAVLALYRLPAGGKGDNLPVIKFEQLGERADLLKGEQRIEQYGGLFHQSLLSPQPRRGRTGWSVVHVLKSIQPRLGLGPAVAVLDKEHGDKAQGDEKGRVGE